MTTEKTTTKTDASAAARKRSAEWAEWKKTMTEKMGFGGVEAVLLDRMRTRLELRTAKVARVPKSDEREVVLARMREAVAALEKASEALRELPASAKARGGRRRAEMTAGDIVAIGPKHFKQYADLLTSEQASELIVRAVRGSWTVVAARGEDAPLHIKTSHLHPAE